VLPGQGLEMSQAPNDSPHEPAKGERNKKRQWIPAEGGPDLPEDSSRVPCVPAGLDSGPESRLRERYHVVEPWRTFLTMLTRRW